MNASNSGMRAVNYNNANNFEIRAVNYNNANNSKSSKTAKKVFEDRYFSSFSLEKAKNKDSGYRIFYYIDKKGKNIVGIITLTIVNIAYKGQIFRNLSSIITGKKVYELSIKIFKEFRGKKYTSDFLEKIFDQIIYKEDAIIYFISNSGFDYEPTNNHDIENNTADRIFHGKNINDKFDVYIMLNDNKGQYLIGKKISPIMKPKYLELNTSYNSFPPITSKLNKTRGFLSNIAKNHITRYLENHPKNRPTNSSP